MATITPAKMIVKVISYTSEKEPINLQQRKNKQLSEYWSTMIIHHSINHIALNCFAFACAWIPSMSFSYTSFPIFFLLAILLNETQPFSRTLMNSIVKMNIPIARNTKYPKCWLAYLAKRNCTKTANKYPNGVLQSNGNLMLEWKMHVKFYRPANQLNLF